MVSICTTRMREIPWPAIECCHALIGKYLVGFISHSSPEWSFVSTKLVSFFPHLCLHWPPAFESYSLAKVLVQILFFSRTDRPNHKDLTFLECKFNL